MLSLKQSTAICLVVLGLCSAAKAQDESETGWQWRLAPMYLWAIQLEGDVSIGPITAPIDIKLSDVFDDLEGVFTANFEGILNNRWGFLIDFTWIDISSGLGPVNVDFEYIQGEAHGFYRVPIDRGAIDWYFGARYYSQDLELSPLPVAVSEDWVDPVVGVRWSLPFADKWTLMLSGDIGGFGVGSDFAWQAIAIVDWQPWKHASIDGGLRVLDVDYETGSGLNRFAYDATVWGPVLGFSLKW